VRTYRANDEATFLCAQRASPPVPNARLWERASPPNCSTNFTLRDLSISPSLRTIKSVSGEHTSLFSRNSTSLAIHLAKREGASEQLVLHREPGQISAVAKRGRTLLTKVEFAVLNASRRLQRAMLKWQVSGVHRKPEIAVKEASIKGLLHHQSYLGNILGGFEVTKVGDTKYCVKL
jgi:hypothetical protein